MVLEALREILHEAPDVRAWDRLMALLRSAGAGVEEPVLKWQGGPTVALDYACEHLQARAEAWRPVALWMPAAWAGPEAAYHEGPGRRLLWALGLDALPMVGLEPGTFLMGAPAVEPRRRGDGRGASVGRRSRVGEGRQREVTLTRGFLMGRVPVTGGLWRAVMGADPARVHGPTWPVVGVSWFDAVRFCNARSQRLGLTPVYDVGEGERPEVSVDREADGFRLPTEAEWEYACRAGTTDARHGAPDEIAWHQGNSQGELHEVGLKRPNPWGLRDMLGNASEWVEDGFALPGRDAAPVSDPVEAASRWGHVIRGGSRFQPGATLDAAQRDQHDPTSRLPDLGFRCARTLP